jgi:hypothetical protein
MLNIDRAWARVSHQFPKKFLREFRFLGVGQNFTLTTGAVSGATRVDFPAGAIILGITAGLEVDNQAGTATIRDLDAISVAIDYPNNEALLTGGRMNGQAVFGTGERCDFPAKEIVIEANGSLTYTVENNTTSTLNISILHHCLVPRRG